jgi:hypothetical protein
LASCLFLLWILCWNQIIFSKFYYVFNGGA